MKVKMRTPEFQISDDEPVEIEERFKCDQCQKVFKRLHGLRVYIGKKHQNRKIEKL